MSDCAGFAASLTAKTMFMANYADVLTDAPLPDMIQRFEASSAVASLLAVPPQSSHHVVDIGDDGLITQVTPMRDLRQWENGGYFVLRPEIFDALDEGEDLVEDAIMRRLVPQAEGACLPVQGILVARGYGEGTRAAGRDVSPGHVPLDDLGSGTVRDAQAGQHGVARTGALGPARREPGAPGQRLAYASVFSAVASDGATRSRGDIMATGSGHGIASSGSSKAIDTSSAGSCGRSMR